MANIMDMVKTRIGTSRNGFDLSKKNIFTAKIGELLPVYCKEVLPGDKFNIYVEAFARTMPVNTAAYTRIREYYDFYFVPTSVMWNRFETFATSMGNNNTQADGITGNTVVGDQHPYMTVRQVLQYIDKIEGQENIFGYSRQYGTRKLLEYLNYGDYFSVDYSFPSRVNAVLNPFPLLAYQKIYQDFYRNSQWEEAYAPACNINYIKGNGDQNLPISELGVDGEKENMFDLRYANWNKDYFFGLMPNSQFGDVASIDVDSIDGITTPFVGGKVGVPNISTGNYGVTVENGSLLATSADGQQLEVRLDASATRSLRDALGLSASSSASDYPLSGVFTVLALRMAEAKQRWKEVIQSNKQDVKSQMSAQYGVNISNAYSDRCQYLGGTASNLDINEVVNTNLTSGNQANIQGKGVGVTQGGINFTSDLHGYIMCVYHAVPLLDYSITGISRQNLKSYLSDYAQPAFDKLGMVSVPLIELTNTKLTDIPYESNPLLGYAPRYIDYKTDIDEVHGGFKNGGLDAWVAPFDDSYITTYMDSLGATANLLPLNYVFFKINPAFMNPIFVGQITDKENGLDKDQLLINAAFDVKAVRNLDVNGLPY